MELVNAFDVTSGFVLTSFESPSDGRTLLHFPAPEGARTVVVHLDCNRAGGRCAPDLQPGEPCMMGRPCAQGLACVSSAGACEATWTSGTCVLPSSGVECEDVAATGPVCGCDGRSYGSACLAGAAGVGVASEGACAPAPPPK